VTENPSVVSASGWPIAVRADFDSAGTGHVAAILKTVPAVVPWRMGVQDYVATVRGSHGGSPLDRVSETPWDPSLAMRMRKTGVAAYEEAVLPPLIEDLRRGQPLVRDR